MCVDEATLMFGENGDQCCFHRGFFSAWTEVQSNTHGFPMRWWLIAQICSKCYPALIFTVGVDPHRPSGQHGTWGFRSQKPCAQSWQVQSQTGSVALLLPRLRTHHQSMSALRVSVSSEGAEFKLPVCFVMMTTVLVALNWLWSHQRPCDFQSVLISYPSFFLSL